MRHTLKCAVCLLMTLAMLFSMVVCVGAVNADVAETSAARTIYFKNTDNWATVNAYVWIKNTSTNVKGWPGEAMTKVKDNVYKYTISGDYNMIIFNNGAGTQTSDLDLAADGQIFDYSTKTWSAYPDHVPTPTTDEEPTTPVVKPTTPVTPGTTKMVYVNNTANWPSVNCYMWTDGAGNNSAWPGQTMTDVGDGIYQYEVTGDFNMIIFNNGAGVQTGNMSFPGDGYIFDNSTNKWDIYDTSPIRVKNFGTNLISPQYIGTEITLTAEAVSDTAVSYKFSVKGTNGTTVIADYSASNKAFWTPTAVGSYEIIYDFMDAAGNTNQRTFEYTVEDDAGVEAPILKGITPKAGQIKKGEQQTITINASGGNTGTKLLFYKLKITDPSGNTANVPFYTKTKSYKFTPTVLGTYTITAYVQGSDNDTVERHYAFVSCENPDDPVIPTPTTPTTPTNPIPTTPVDIIKGDADKDTKVTILDATIIQHLLAQMVTEDRVDTDNADVDGDSKVTILDATRIQHFLAGMITNW